MYSKYERYLYPERYETVRIGWHCAKVKGHAELKIEKSRVKTLSYDFPNLRHYNPNSFRANVHLHQFKKKTVQVIARSHNVTSRSKYEKSKGHPRSPGAPNMVQFRQFFPELRHFEKNAMLHFSLIGCHLESVGRTEPVFELNLALSKKGRKKGLRVSRDARSKTKCIPLLWG